MNIILIHCLNLWYGIHGESNEIYMDSELPQFIVTVTQELRSWVCKWHQHGIGNALVSHVELCFGDDTKRVLYFSKSWLSQYNTKLLLV